jgi:hypothetical protein
MQPGSRARAWVSLLAPVLLSCLLYTQSLTGDFTFDDRAAVKENRDVVQASAPWAQLLRDDFWGGRADLELSHKSYRHGRVGDSSWGSASNNALTCVHPCVGTPRHHKQACHRCALQARPRPRQARGRRPATAAVQAGEPGPARG